ncbi:hypothetical protein O181_082074 [Austropuccinia psidii MF-1]|uniref:Uncharacterized protein n=1 Tax=Austropuccinia psidii MF-1 TaxID=1389203 RepID=A0A9Q3FP07_9BASI|nr:hypothetical protein [Austropuccinia psidii MF-1]
MNNPETSVPDFSTLKIQDESDAVSKADKQAELLSHFITIAEKIRPKLSTNGANFNTWSRNMIETWATVFLGDVSYFESLSRDDDYRHNLIALAFIRHSVERPLFNSITSRIFMPNARNVYQAIKDRFNRASWSSIVHHASLVFNPIDQSLDPNQHALRLGEAIEAIENQMGPLDSTKILTLSLFFSMPHLRDKLTSALDTRLAINPLLAVRPEDILDIVRQMSSSASSSIVDESSQLARIDATKPPLDHRARGQLKTPPRTGSSSHKSFGASSPIMSRSDDWKKKWLTPRHPCFHCGESGHWVPDCPARKRGVAACAQSSQRSASVAAIGVIPMFEKTEALLDSGATHLVVGDISLFVNIRPANMNLSVASSHRFSVEGIGELRLETPSGRLYIKDVLYCKAITGIVLSIGQMISQQIVVTFSRNCFILEQNNVSFVSFNRANRWFLPLSPPCSPDVSLQPVEVSENPPPLSNPLDDSFLWHQRLGHLSIRNIKRLLKFNAATGISPSSLNDIKRLRTDNGAEYKNNFLTAFLHERGIIHETSIPYEHHQNGKIERTNRSILEIARTILIASQLPRELWPYAFRHAVWIFNRVLHADGVATPYEIIAKRKPSLAPLRVFGAKGYIYDHLFRKDLSERATVGYHLGEAPDSKGWLFWVPEGAKIVKGASVKFDEACFWRKESGDAACSMSIQVSNVFDTSMIRIVDKQDKFVDSINVSFDPINAAPINYKMALSSAEAPDWNIAINKEIDSMKAQDVFIVSTISDAIKEVPRESILSTKWVFTKKSRPTRFKARLVAQGFRQIHGINFKETFAPTPTFTSLRLLFSIALRKGWKVRTFDVNVAFLNSLIDRPVYIWPPQGLKLAPNSVLKLKKALYGTKQAARCWWLHLQEILRNIGFVVNLEDTSTYYFDSPMGQAMLWIHVDDGSLAASSNELLSFISSKLDDALKIKWDDVINGLVGILITATSDGFKFHQPDLISKLLETDASNITARSPLPAKCALESSTGGSMDKEYLRRIGMLLYIAQGSRPDISYAVNYLARFSLGPTSSHWDALRHLIGYLRFTQHEGILLSKCAETSIRCYVDANWGGEANRSTHGYILFHGDNPIAWQSKRQALVAGSTAQAEYLALSFAAKECLWISHLFAPILRSPIPNLLSDNKTAIGIATDSVSRKQTRHLIREFNVINEYIVRGKIRLDWISTKEQLADIMTKSLGHVALKNINASILRN